MAIFGFLQNFYGFHLVYCEICGFQLNLQFKSSDALLDLPGKGEMSGESFDVIICILRLLAFLDHLQERVW